MLDNILMKVKIQMENKFLQTSQKTKINNPNKNTL